MTFKKIRGIPPKEQNKDRTVESKNDNLSVWQIIYNNHLEEVHLAIGGLKRQQNKV